MEGKRIGVLLVDDEPRELDVMRHVLESNHIHVWTGNDYNSARSIFAEHQEALDIVITDVSLPGRTGIELASCLLKKKPELKVLLISGYVGAEVIRYYGMRVNDSDFLQKPFTADIFIERVHLLLGSSKSGLSDNEETQSGGSVTGGK